MSLSLFSSAEQTTNPFTRRKSSLESTQNLTVSAEPKEKEQAEGVSSPALDALMPFVPLMFRRDLLLPEPTFAAMQVACPALCTNTSTLCRGCQCMFESRPHLASASLHVVAQTWASQQVHVSPLSMQELCLGANYVHAQEPCMRTHQGAVMIADITGFTALTEDLGRRGASGVELLTRCMNNYFTLVIELVRLFFFLSGVPHFAAGPECQKANPCSSPLCQMPRA